WEFSQRDEPFLEVDALLTEREEEIGARVRVDDGLKRDLRFVHLERRRRVHRVLARGAEEIADHSHVGIEHFRVADRGSVSRQRLRRLRRCSGGRRRLGDRRRLDRRRSRGRRPFGGRQFLLERSEALAVLLLQGFEVLPQLIDLLPQRLRVVLRERARWCERERGGHYRGTHESPYVHE